MNYNNCIIVRVYLAPVWRCVPQRIWSATPSPPNVSRSRRYSRMPTGQIRILFYDNLPSTLNDQVFKYFLKKSGFRIRIGLEPFYLSVDPDPDFDITLKNSKFWFLTLLLYLLYSVYFCFIYLVNVSMILDNHWYVKVERSWVKNVEKLCVHRTIIFTSTNWILRILIWNTVLNNICTGQKKGTDCHFILYRGTRKAISGHQIKNYSWFWSGRVSPASYWTTLSGCWTMVQSDLATPTSPCRLS